MCEVIAIEKCSSSMLSLLSAGVVDCGIFGQALVSAGFMSHESLANTLDALGVGMMDKARKLFQCVYAQVKFFPEKYFSAFLNILEQFPALQMLLNNVVKEYSKCPKI